MPLFSKVKDIFKGGGANKKKKVYHNVKLENPEELWDVQYELGDGAYGKVYKCQHKENGTLAALKQVALEAEEDLETFMIEIDILSEFRHENVVELLEAYHYDGKLWMYLEYCDGGAMDSIMVDLDRPLNESQIAYVTKQLCQALIYIHENKVIHRDLKAGNVLLTMGGGIKLADFGVSAKNKNTYDKRGTFIGTPYWLAPEVILCETFIDAKYDYKADIWSLGISLIEFAQMDPPNHDVSPVRVMLKIQKSEPPKLDYPSKFSKEFNDFIAKCLVKDPNQRPTAAELLKHPFIDRDLSDKPIKDLLLEYKAEVVEVEEDVDEEDRTSHLSIDSDVSTRQDDSTLQPSTPSQEKEAEKPKIIIENVTKDEKEVPSGERKMSKGPAPPPPTVSSSSAPTATAASSPSSVVATPGAITSPSKGKARPAPAAPTATTNSTNAPAAAVTTAVASPTKPQAPAPPTAAPVASPTSPVDKPVVEPTPPASSPASPAPTPSSAITQSPTSANSSALPAAGKATQPDSPPNVVLPHTQPEAVAVTPEKVLKPDIPEPAKTPVVSKTDNLNQSKSSDVNSVPVQPVVEISDVIKDPKRTSTEIMDTSESEPKTESENIDQIPSAIPIDQVTHENIPVEPTNMEVDKMEVVNVSNKEQNIKDLPTKMEVEVSDNEVVNNEISSNSQPEQLKTIAKKASDAALSATSVSSASPPNITVDTEVSVVEPQVLHISDASNADLPASEVELLASDSPADSTTIIASIGSEGTVIVRTPTPTPIDNAQTSQQTPKKQSVVTYSGPAIVDGDEVSSSETPEATAGDATDAVATAAAAAAATAAAVTAATQTPQKELPSSPPVSDKSSPSSPSLSEAEEQAVRMLDSAIDSAGSGTVEDSSVDERDEADNAALLLVRDDKLHNDVDATQHRDEVNDKDSVTEVTVSGSPEKVVHKLDESEVVISNSSILHDNEESENEPQIKARYELTLEDLDNSTEQPSKIDTSMDTANISVVAVEIPSSPVAASEEKKQSTNEHSESDNQGNLETSSNISNISNLSSDTHESTGRSISSGEEDVRPVSVTIAGTTLSHTDVDDDVFDQTEHQQTKNDKEISSDLVQQKRENALPSQKPALVRDITIESNVSVDVSASSPTSVSSSKLSDTSSPTTPLTPLAPTIITTPNNLPNGIGKDSHKISDVTKNEQNDIDNFEVVTLRNPDAVRKPVSHAVQSKIQAKIDDKENQNREEQESIALRKKMRKRTRKFVIDGVVVTTTTSKVIYGDDEEISTLNASHLARKQELRELKVLQRQEQKQFQELGVKANFAKLEQEKKFDAEKQQLLRGYDTEVEGLNRQQKQQVEKAEASQEMELKMSSKRIRTEQEKELKSFREALKTELKLLKQEIDLLPKDKRKEALKVRKERLENDQNEREKAFLEKLHESHELSLKRLGDDHRERIALLERQFLQQKHQLLRSRESALWEMEERHLHEKHQLAKRQLKDIFFLQRHQMLLRHEKELEQVKRMNVQKEDELVKRQQVERRALPKRIRQEMKAREMMFRESMRISTSHLPDSHEDEKDRLKKFQDGEKKRYEAEKKRAEQKHKRQLEELQAASESTSKELEQLQNEKRKMLMEHETYKLRCQDEEYQRELREWKANLKPRKQKLEEEFEKQLSEQEQFYGAYLSRGLGSSMTPSQSTASLRSSTASYRDS